MNDQRPLSKAFWSYVGYGLAACVFLVIPLVAIDWIIRTLPFLDDLIEWLLSMETPGIGLIIGLSVVVALLAVMGYLLRQVFWDRLKSAPVIGTILSSTESLSKALGGLDRKSTELVAWAQFWGYRNLGVVMSRNVDPDGTECATLYMLSSAGNFQGNSLCNVPVKDLVFPGWTIDEAVVFSSSGGAVIPEASRP